MRLSHILDRLIGLAPCDPNAFIFGLLNGAIYVLFVLFIPYGIVGTWRLWSLQIKQGWDRLLGMFSR